MDYYYLALSIQYFCLARFGSRFPFNPVSGNLYHHSFELLLKAYLHPAISAQDLQYKYGHNLQKLWETFKDRTSENELDTYDLYIKNLDAWERVRYLKLASGKHASSIVIHEGHAPKEYLESIATIKNSELMDFSLYLDDMDELFQVIFFATKQDPQSLLVNHGDMIAGINIYEKDNKFSIFKK